MLSGGLGAGLLFWGLKCRFRLQERSEEFLASKNDFKELARALVHQLLPGSGHKRALAPRYAGAAELDAEAVAAIKVRSVPRSGARRRHGPPLVRRGVLSCRSCCPGWLRLGASAAALS
jgi:hypothetical protein